MNGLTGAARRIVTAAGCWLLWIGVVAGAGELPEAVGPVTLGAPTPAGTWMEYHLSLPVDPLEALLHDQAIQAAQAMSDADADATRPAGRAAGGREKKSAAEDTSGNAAGKIESGTSAAPATIVPTTPVYELPLRWARYPVRLTVRAASPLTLEVEVRTPGGLPTTATLARTGPLAGDIRAAMAAWMDAPRMENGPSATDIDAGVAAGPVAGPVGGMGSAEPDEVGRATWALFDREVEVSTARYGAGAGAGAVEIWTAPEIPLGVAWLRTRDMELSLRGFGAGDAPAFPLPEAAGRAREE